MSIGECDAPAALATSQIIPTTLSDLYARSHSIRYRPAAPTGIVIVLAANQEAGPLRIEDKLSKLLTAGVAT
jgi:hypothetical protein